MTEVKWIKIDLGIFDNDKIKLIDSMPESDAIFRIWIHLLILAGKTNNNGLIYITPEIPVNEENLVSITHKSINIIRLALNLFCKFEMISVLNDKKILIKNWHKYQSIDGLAKIKEQNKIRQQKYREKQTKAIEFLNFGEKEEDIKNEKEIVIKKVIDYLNLKANKRYTYVNSKNISARYEEGYKFEDFKKVIDNKLLDEFFKKNPKFLNPVTLFRPSKFEIYLNETYQDNQKNNKDWTIK